MFDDFAADQHGAVIKVMGVGGCGGNALSHMISRGVSGVDFIALNTDSQALSDVSADYRFQLGRNTTRGLGAGANPEIGRQAAMEDRETLSELLTGADMVFITAGMGGGTGTGASPVIAELAKEMGILTVAVVTKPFPFEGRNRLKIAEEGILKLQEHVDSLIVIPNEKLLAVLGRDTSLMSAFHAANEVLLNAIKGIADLITCPGIINVDFADVRSVMSNRGVAIMGTATSSSTQRAIEATEQAIRSPLMEDVDLLGARSILVNITAGIDLTLGEFTEVGDTVEKFSAEGAMIVVGTVIDPEISEEIKVTLIATGLNTLSVNSSDRLAERQKIHFSSSDNSPQFNRSNTTSSISRDSHRHYADRNIRAQNDKVVNEKEEFALLDIPTFLRRHFKI